MCLRMFVRLISFFFFFSSRRRHTRYIGDWSSDVCSSDLVNLGINQPADRGNTIGGDIGFASVFPDSILVGSKVNAVDLIFGHVAVEPLNLRPYVLQALQRAQRNLSDLRFA